MKMKRILFILFFALTTLMALHAQAPTALWGKAVETAKFTAGSDLCLGTDGSLYVVGNANTRTEEEYIRLGADNLAPGSLYRGTNTTASVGAIYLSKLSRDGQPLWTVYTRDADAMSNSLFVQPTADGVVAFVGLRHVEKGATHSPYFTDAKGRQVSLEWALEADDSARYCTMARYNGCARWWPTMPRSPPPPVRRPRRPRRRASGRTPSRRMPQAISIWAADRPPS